MRMKKGLGEQEWGNLRLNDLKSLGLFLHTLRDDDTAFALRVLRPPGWPETARAKAPRRALKAKAPRLDADGRGAQGKGVSSCVTG